MLTHDDVRAVLSAMKRDADRADKALAADNGIPPIELAAAAVELDKLRTKLDKLAGRLGPGGNGKARGKRR